MAQKKVDHQTRKMFRPAQGEMFEKRRNQKVECLGMTFDNDDARREYFRVNRN